MPQKSFWMGFGSVAIVGILVWLLFLRETPEEEGAKGELVKAKSEPSRTAPPTATITRTGSQKGVTAIAKAEPDEEVELTEVERHKLVDKANMKTIHGGLTAFFAKHGRYPDYLSEMVPDFIPAEALESPRGEKDGMNMILKRDHQDPGLKKAAYGYEYSNLVAYGDRTFQEIKDVQRAEWGDVVPLLRAFGYDKVMNLNWAGEIYETQLMWEHDEKTLDLIEKYGWGPGMDAAGNSVEVVVTDQNGRPVAGAEVWAAGRNHTFPLPERPFVTGADGEVDIPLGTDAASAALKLRFDAPGLAMEPVEFDRGAAPGRVEVTSERAVQVRGVLLDNDGNPMRDTRVVLSGAPNENGVAPFINYARTDSNGNWIADVLPADAEGVTATPRFRR